MRVLITGTRASALIAAVVLMGMAPALAQNVDADNPYFDHAEGTMSTNAGKAAGSKAPSYLATHRHYLQVEPRDAKASAAVQGADADNPYFDHAEGTMSTNAGKAASSTAGQRGQYVATHHLYMQMDLRDARAAPGSSHNVDAGNPYFNHAMGTMGN